MKNPIAAFCCVLAFAACGDIQPLSNDPSVSGSELNPDGSITVTEKSLSPPQAKTLAINLPSPLILTVGQSQFLSVSGTTSDGGTFENLATAYNRPWVQDAFPVVWYINDKSVATVDAAGLITAKTAGKTKLKADLLGASAMVEVIVQEPEIGPTPTPTPAPTFTPAKQAPSPPPPAPPPPTPKPEPKPKSDQTSQTKPAPPKPDTFTNPAVDCTIGTDEILTMSYGEMAGNGQDKYPEILFGEPEGLGDLLTFGFGGALTIAWHGCTPVDAPGPDFTVFENPLGPGVFSERAKVSVSADGVTYVDFPCSVDDFDNLYPGCAGVYPPNLAANSFDPKVSGGDQYDLAALGVPLAKFIRIEDLKTCHKGDLTYPVCAFEGKEGFDLDAVVILHGKKE